ncbi:MAG TPA: tRNA (adenosine(37)-N6)-threonylcarbamoyltransferase complex transferase subunit TsaD [Abditibacteriaceae bacterium]|jgi:N6-L-threonylcarbamoyladenine synthase
MFTLGIETSCDETSVAILRDRSEIVVNLIASQIDAHQLFGGVVPEIASRKHLELLNPLLGAALEQAQISWRDLDLIAVTHGPGLAGALLVGVAAAKALSFAHGIPCQPVNHIEGHILSNFLAEPDLQLPMLSLVVSGGHSDLILMRDFGVYERLGRTRDDAIGEAYDKVARALGLPLPGGPNLEKLALSATEAIEFSVSNMEPSLDVSYSGLKTAASQAAQKYPDQIAAIAAGFQRAAIAQLRRNVERALREFQPKTLGLCGGVAANSTLRGAMQEAAQQAGINFVVPDKILCTDNAAMIAVAGFYRYRIREEKSYSVQSLNFEAHSVLPVA